MLKVVRINHIKENSEKKQKREAWSIVAMSVSVALTQRGMGWLLSKSLRASPCN